MSLKSRRNQTDI